MSAVPLHSYGPYTIYDLDAMPEDGKRYELADGWLTELSPSTRHDHAADVLKDILKEAALKAGHEVYVAGGSNDVQTPAGVRKPDVFVLPREAARRAHETNTRTYYGGDLLIAVEVVSPRSASERNDRVKKVREYAQAGIDQYWLVDLEPHPSIMLYELDGEHYRVVREIPAGRLFQVDLPFAIEFDPAVLLEFD